jgi:hypothetical protein
MRRAVSSLGFVLRGRLRPRVKPAIGLTVVVLGCAAIAAALALGQAPIPIKVTAVAKVTPNKAGTPRHPQGVKIDVRARIHIPAQYDPPLVQSVDVWFPRAGVYNGAKFPRCSQNTLARRGLTACPRGSIMGHGTGDALADTVITHPQITVVNGGPTRVYFYTVLNNPARVQAPVPGIVTKLAHGRWGYKLHAVIPKVLQVVAGVPIKLQTLHIVAGRGDWVATTSCPPSRRWGYHVEAHFETGQTIGFNGSVACR